MSVMRVRNVRVIVRERGVGVEVRMPLANLGIRLMRMIVVLIVDVDVLVLHGLVRMNVRVPGAKQRHHSRSHGQHAHDLECGRSLV